MTSPHFDSATAAKIEAARSVKGVPLEDCTLPWPNFAHMWQEVAQKQNNSTCVVYIDGDTRTAFSYTDYFAHTCRIANFMRYKLGVLPGQAVSSVAYNHPDTVALAYACWMIGAVYVPINITEDDERLVFIHQNTEVTACFVMPDLLERVDALRPQLTSVLHFVDMGDANTAPGGDWLHLYEALAKQDTTFDAPDSATLTTPSLIVYTSGTTGAPKGVVLQQVNMLAEAQAIAGWYTISANDTTMVVLPIHHVNALMLSTLTTHTQGGTVVLNRKFSASRYWQIVQDEKCTFGSVVPTILSYLCEAHPNRDAYSIDNDFYIICGAGPLTVELGQKFEERFHIPLIHGYGLSETTVYSCYLPKNLHEEERKVWMRDYGYPSIGVALPCNEMAIHDSSGNPVKPGEKGEIVVRGHNLMQGYFKRPDANADAFAHGWFRTGDEGFYEHDAHGRAYFFITGRLKELIIRGGVNYSPLEIDEVINRIPGVKAGMAVGFENNFYGEEVGAYVVCEPGANLKEADVLAACATLPYAKQPKVVVFGEEVPVTATGKYQRNRLKPLFAAHKNTQFRAQKAAS